MSTNIVVMNLKTSSVWMENPLDHVVSVETQTVALLGIWPCIHAARNAKNVDKWTAAVKATPRFVSTIPTQNILLFVVNERMLEKQKHPKHVHPVSFVHKTLLPVPTRNRAVRRTQRLAKRLRQMAVFSVNFAVKLK
jgi:hypothetical protein